MLLAMLLTIDLLLILCFAFVPYYTRRTELFGVSLPAEHSRDAQLMRLRASYRNQLLIGGALLLIF
ncbi:MAG: hypothetical protein LBC35_07645 [Coriobacteriales bacterium]|jgi:hypothetical protein|nr:hypothetical protein [Coriobacteriales bacterium]